MREKFDLLADGPTIETAVENILDNAQRDDSIHVRSWSPSNHGDLDQQSLTFLQSGHCNCVRLPDAHAVALV